MNGVKPVENGPIMTGKRNGQIHNTHHCSHLTATGRPRSVRLLIFNSPIIFHIHISCKLQNETAKKTSIWQYFLRFFYNGKIHKNGQLSQTCRKLRKHCLRSGCSTPDENRNDGESVVGRESVGEGEEVKSSPPVVTPPFPRPHQLYNKPYYFKPPTSPINNNNSQLHRVRKYDRSYLENISPTLLYINTINGLNCLIHNFIPLQNIFSKSFSTNFLMNSSLSSRIKLTWNTRINLFLLLSITWEYGILIFFSRFWLLICSLEKNKNFE